MSLSRPKLSFRMLWPTVLSILCLNGCGMSGPLTLPQVPAPPEPPPSLSNPPPQ